jgi:hypothetical protein
VSLCPYEKGRKKNNRNDFRNQINIVKSKPFCALNFNRLIGLLPPSFRITYHVCVHVCLKERVFVWSLLFLWLLLSTERKNKISSGQRQKQEIEKVFSAPKDLMEFECETEIFVLYHVVFFFSSHNTLSHTHLYIEYDFEWLSVGDESVHQNNACMIEMLTLTKRTKFSYWIRTTLYTSVWGLSSYLTMNLLFLSLKMFTVLSFYHGPIDLRLVSLITWLSKSY